MPGPRRLPDQDQSTNPVGGNGQQPSGEPPRAVTYATHCLAAHCLKFMPNRSHRALLRTIGRLSIISCYPSPNLWRHLAADVSGKKDEPGVGPGGLAGTRRWPRSPAPATRLSSRNGKSARSAPGNISRPWGVGAQAPWATRRPPHLRQGSGGGLVDGPCLGLVHLRRPTRSRPIRHLPLGGLDWPSLTLVQSSARRDEVRAHTSVSVSCGPARRIRSPAPAL